MMKGTTSPTLVPLYGWFVFFLLFPFYVFSSGLPQPADMLMAVLVGFVIIAGWRERSAKPRDVVNSLKYFVILVVVINSAWAPFIDQSIENIPSYFHSLFYVYNFFVFSTAITLAGRYGDKFLLFTAYAVGGSLILQALLAIATGSIASRNSLFFNNPNQLGYYALLAGSLFVYMVRAVKINTIFQVGAYFAFLFLTLLSASKAALSGAGILVSLAIFNQGLLSTRQFIVLAFSIGIGYYFISSGGLGTDLFTYASDRFDTIGTSSDDSVEGRGYDRILNDPEFLLFGAGEGGYYRFDTFLKAAEIHSTFGTIIFCYGILGLTLFLRLLKKVFQYSTRFELLYFVPVLVYSITHQGLRSTLLWVFLACIFAVNNRKWVLAVKRKMAIAKAKHMRSRQVASAAGT